MHHGHYGPLTPGSSLAPSFPYCPCGPGASGIPGIPGMPFNSGILENPWAKVDFWREKINTDWLEQQPQENNKKKPVHKSREISYNGDIWNKLEILLIFPFFDLSTISTIILFHTHCFQLVCDTALFTISPFSPLDPCSPFTPLIPGGPLLPRDPSSPLSPFIPITPVEPFNLVMHLSGLINGAKWPLISFFSSCFHHPSRYLDTRPFLSSRKYWSCWHNSGNHTEKTFRISLKRRILLCRNILRIFWPSFIKIRKIYIHY